MSFNGSDDVFKYIILLIAYALGFTMTMLGALAIAAFSI